MSENREYSTFARGWKWANDLAAKCGRVQTAPVNLEPTFIFLWKLEQFETEYDKDQFVAGYRSYHEQNRSKG